MQTNFSLLDADLRRYRTYSSGEKQFKNFYYQFHLYKHVSFLPTTETILIYFAVSFLEKTLNPDTIKVCLAAVHHMHLVKGYDLPIAKFQRFNYILREIKRVKGVCTRKHACRLH